MADTEQNKTEEPTPFKLRRSREKGMVARGTDLGFFSTLAALSLFALLAGPRLGSALLAAMQRLLGDAIIAAAGADVAPMRFAALAKPALMAVAPLGLSVLIVVGVFEIIRELRTSFHLSAAETRLQPPQSRAGSQANCFSGRMLKETLKSILKLIAYAIVGYVLVASVRDSFSDGAVNDAGTLARSMNSTSMRLLFTFALIAFVFAMADQVLARADFLKRMRMSRGELTREHRDREGDHRIKQKRKQLHAEFAKQANATRNLAGSDMPIVIHSTTLWR